MKRSIPATVILLLLYGGPALTQTLLPGGKLNATCYNSSQNNEIQVLGLTSGGTWISSDFGETWNEVQHEYYPQGVHPVRLYGIDFIDANADTILLQYSSTPQRWQYVLSTDQGDTWTTMGVGSSYTYGHLFLLSQFNHQQLIHLDPSRICISNNFGESWDCWNYNPYWNQQLDLIQDVSIDSTLYLASGYYGYNEEFLGGVMRSDDLGTTWYPILPADTLLDAFDVTIVEMLMLSNGSLLAFPISAFADPNSTIPIDTPPILRTNDRGESWSIPENNGLPLTAFVSSAAEDPAQPGTIYLSLDWGAGLSGLFYSQDYGASFVPADEPALFLSSPIRSIQTNQSTGKVYICTDGSGIYTPSNNGNRFSQVELPDNWGRHGVLHVATDRIYQAGVQDPYIETCEFSSSEWNPVSLSALLDENSETTFGRIFTIGTSLGVLEINTPLNTDLPAQNRICITSDNGVSWDTSATPRDYDRHYSLNPPFDFYSNSSFVRIASSHHNGENWFLDVSTDTGRTWTTTAGWSNAEYYQISFEQNDSLVYSSIPYSGIYKSSDAGLTWEDLGFPYADRLRSKSALQLSPETNELYLFSRDSVFCYESGNWIATGTTNNPYYSLLIPTDPPLLVETYGNEELRISSDMGQSWELIDDLPHSESLGYLGEMIYEAESERLWIDTSLGPLYFELQELTTPDESTFPASPGEHTLLQLSPNPTNSQTTIEFVLPAPGTLSLAVYSIEGRLLKTLLDETRSPGTYQTTLDASGMSSGIYFVRLTTEHETVTRKLTLLK